MTESTIPRWRLILNGKSAGDDGVREAVAALRDSGVRLDVRVADRRCARSRWSMTACST